MSLDPVEAMQITQRDLACAVMTVDDLGVRAVRDCDWETLARLRDVVRRAKADLADVDRELENQLARLMPARQVEVNGLGQLTRHTGGEWVAWNDLETADLVAAAAIEAKPGTDDPFTAAGIAVRAVLEAASVEWRVKALRAAGVDPASVATRVDTRATVQMPKLDRSAT